MAEILLSAFLTVVFEILASESLNKVARSKGIDSDLKKLNRSLIQIKDLLNDASDKEITNPAVRRWLNGLQHLGKTTLARLLYDEMQGKDYFALRAWVCVSDDFDIFKISNQAYHLSVYALLLFAQHALGESSFDSHPTLKPHGEGIVKKCDGLPLALIALRRLLRTKIDEEEWKELLNSEIWRLGKRDEIVPALRLSYYDLSASLKQLFAYCSLFPKGYVFDMEELILLWMAEGFLPQLYTSKSIEELILLWMEELILLWMAEGFLPQSNTSKSIDELILLWMEELILLWMAEGFLPQSNTSKSIEELILLWMEKLILLWMESWSTNATFSCHEQLSLDSCPNLWPGEPYSPLMSFSHLVVIMIAAF